MPTFETRRTHTERRGVPVARVKVELVKGIEASLSRCERGLGQSVRGSHVVTTLLVNTPVVRAVTTCVRHGGALAKVDPVLSYNHLTVTGRPWMYEVQKGLADAAPRVLKALVAEEIWDVFDAWPWTRAGRTDSRTVRQHQRALLPAI